MKTLILAAIYAAIVTQSEGCNIIKKYTGREWDELPILDRSVYIVGCLVFLFILIMAAGDIKMGIDRRKNS